MADATYQVPCYIKQGGAEFVVGSGGKLRVETGGQIVPNSGTVAANVTAFTSSANMSSAQIAKLNAMRVALINVGILATG